MSGARSDEQAAHNEVLFRDANESLAQRREEIGVDMPLIPFLCECEREACMEIVRLSLPEYGRARENKRTFLVLPGHEEGLNEVEVYERDERFVLIEKFGRMGELVEREEAKVDGV